MGTSPLKDGLCVEKDEHYLHEISIKRKLLSGDHAYYYRSSSATAQAQWEAVEKVLNNLVKSDPQNFVLQRSGEHWTWENKLLDEKVSFLFGDATTLPNEPLDWAGRQVQEDLVIMGADGTLLAGQLCFPSGWSLTEKFGKYFLDIHAPLPAFMMPMMQAANKLLERIPAHAPIARNNWGFRVTDKLDLSSRHTAHYKEQLYALAPHLTVANIGSKVFIRVEHQTLSRLSGSGCILFTIHTYNNTVEDEVRDESRAQTLLSFLKTVPAELLEYKSMTPFAPTLIRYLQGLTSC
jgi:hypothetical protein